ncbi:MAG: hypothetical protein ACRD93_04150 [Nitrososphaeraceae archaeon]
MSRSAQEFIARPLEVGNDSQQTNAIIVNILENFMFLKKTEHTV